MGYFEIGVLTVSLILIAIEGLKLYKQSKDSENVEKLQTAYNIALSNKEVELEATFEEWKQEYEKIIRKDSVDKSKHITRGYILQNLLPLLKVDLTKLSGEDEINFNDFQAMGSPIDYIYFKGLSDGNLEEIKFIEVKSTIKTPTGRTSISLPKRERQIRDIIKEGKVSWELVHIELEEQDIIENSVENTTNTQPLLDETLPKL